MLDVLQDICLLTAVLGALAFLSTYGLFQLGNQQAGPPPTHRGQLLYASMASTVGLTVAAALGWALLRVLAAAGVGG